MLFGMGGNSLSKYSIRSVETSGHCEWVYGNLFGDLIGGVSGNAVHPEDFKNKSCLGDTAFNFLLETQASGYVAGRRGNGSALADQVSFVLDEDQLLVGRGDVDGVPEQGRPDVMNRIYRGPVKPPTPSLGLQVELVVLYFGGYVNDV